MIFFRTLALNYFTVQLYTAWCQPGLSFDYETSLTIRWLKEMMEEMNYRMLTTSPWNNGAVGKMRKSSIYKNEVVSHFQKIVWVVVGQPITLSLQTRVEVEWGCDKQISQLHPLRPSHTDIF